MKKYLLIAVTAITMIACTSEDGWNPKEDIKTSDITVETPDPGRVTNYKSGTTRAVQQDVITAIGFVTSMPDMPSTPAEAKDLTQVTTPWNTDFKGKYYVAAGATYEANNLNLNGGEFYVSGTMNISNVWGQNVWTGNGAEPTRIYILPGGTVNYSINTAYNAMQMKVYNWGTFNYTGSDKIFYVNGKTSGYYCQGDLDLGSDDISFRLNDAEAYIGGDVHVRKFDIETYSTCYVAGDLKLDTDLNVYQNLAVRGEVYAPNISLLDRAHFIADCKVTTPGQFLINANPAEAWVNYVKAGSVFSCATSKIHVEDGALFDVAGDYTDLNNSNDAAFILHGDGAKAVVKAARIGNNTGNGVEQTLLTFRTAADSEGAQIALDAADGFWFINNSNQYQNKLDVDNLNLMPNVYAAADQVAAFSMAPNGCAPGYNYNASALPALAPRPVIEAISKIEPDHTHDISATCVMSANGLTYIAYHQRGTTQSGCVEIARTENNQTTLLQFLRDHSHVYDFNHLMIDQQSTPQRLFVTGNSSKKGAILAYMNLTDAGLFDVSNPADSTIHSSTALPMSYIRLKAGNGGDGNCLIRSGNYLQVMTTYGYEVFNANTLEPVADEQKPGKAKHIYSDGNTVITSYLTQRTSDEEAEIPVQAQTFSADDYFLTSPLSTIDAGVIQPNNGKNVTKIDGNKIYICLGRDGLKVIDNGVQKTYQPAGVTTASGKYKAYCNGVAFDSKYIYLAYGTFGFIVLDKNTLEEVASYKCTKSANYINISNGYIYVAYGRDELQVFKLIEP